MIQSQQIYSGEDVVLDTCRTQTLTHLHPAVRRSCPFNCGSQNNNFFNYIYCDFS